MRAVLCSFAVIFLSAGLIFAQSPEREGDADQPGSLVQIALDVPEGTPLRVVLDKEVRIRKAGQPIQGKIAEPIYAYDKLVVPAGSEVEGSITRIFGVSTWKRTQAALNSNFSPTRQIEIAFDRLKMPEGREISIRTRVSPGSEGVLQFATAADANDNGEKKKGLKASTSAKVSEKKREISQDWNSAKQQFTAPGKMHRLKRFAIAQLPVHPQYLDAGTRFNAELLDPLNFGSEELPPEKVGMVGTAPADGSIIHALLKTELDSASSQKGETVEAVMTQPLLAEEHLILPAGTVLKGSVLQVQPARRLHRNGQLRIVFHQIVPPGAAEQHVEASLEGVEVKSDQNLSLDSEGGAQANTPRTRYLTTGISIALAASSLLPDADAGQAGQSGMEVIKSGANGASGYGLIGFITGAVVNSRPVTAAFGVYGASMSVYSNFLSRGRDVIYPKDTAMAIGFGARVTKPAKAGASNSRASPQKSLDASK